MDTQQSSRPTITPAMREQAARQPNSWLYVVDPIFTDPGTEVPSWGFIGGYRVDAQGVLTDDFSPNPHYRPSPVALRLPAPANDVERALQLTTTGYAQGETLLSALLEAELILFAQPQGSGLFTLEHESGRRQLQVFTSDVHLPTNWTTWQRMTGRHLAEHQLTGIDVQINPASQVKARVPGEDLVRAVGSVPHQAPSVPLSAPPADEPTRTNIPAPGAASNTAAPEATPPDTAGPATAAPRDQSTSEHADSDFGQRFLGALLAGAIGDALGAAVEFHPVDRIRSRYGKQGVTDYDRDGDQPGEFTDDTQMALFTLEGLIRGHIAVRTAVAGTPLPAVQLAYQRWLHTQGPAWQQAAGPFLDTHPEPDGWLIEQRSLFNVRSPGSSGIAALREFAAGSGPGTFDHALHDSRSCGGVVRAAPVALWSDEPKEVFELASATAALTDSNPSDYLPAGVLAVLVHRLLRGESLTESIRQARSVLVTYAGHVETDRALQSAVDLAEQGTPKPERLKDALGGGWSGDEALAIAVCAALSTDNTASAIMVAVNHSGDSDSTGAICGNLVGALYGFAALPGMWLGDLQQRELIEKLGRDALLEFGPLPPEYPADPQWAQRYPADRDTAELPFPSTPQPASAPTEQGGEGASPATSDRAEEEQARESSTITAVPARNADGASPDRPARILGCLLGGAVGDALGYAIEFEPIEVIRRKYGGAGLIDFVDAHRPGGSISDDTQMTLFTLEGLIRASIRRRRDGEADPATRIQHAYQRWLHTQGYDWKDAGGPIAQWPPDGWLIRQPGLFARRAPGTTCVQALHDYAGGNRAGSFANRLNDFKGCGGVMRAAPASLWSDEPSEVFRVGALSGALTHGHPSGFLPAGTLAVIVQQLLAGRPLTEAVDRALDVLSTWEDHHETTACLHRARGLAAQGSPSAERIQNELGGGWVGEEALGIAVYAALAHPDSFPDAIVLAANHSGDSDSTAAICGNIMGAALASTAIPRKWREKLELCEVIEQLALDAVQEFGPHPPTGSGWLEHYPCGDGPERADSPHSGDPSPSTASTAFVPVALPATETKSHPDEAGSALSEEERQLLAAWRKFRGNGDAPAESARELHEFLSETLGTDRLADEAAGEPPHHTQLPAETPVELSPRERLSGCLLGGAVGDALGAPWILTDLDGIQRLHPDGVRELAAAFGRRGAVTSYTQQAAFVLDGLIRSNISSKLQGVGAHRASMVRCALEHWLCTQGVPFEPSMPVNALGETALLRTQRFPDEPSMVALARWSGRQDLPTTAHPPNTARSAAATTRSAVVGLYAQSPSHAVALGVEIGVITHGSPDGYLPAGALAGMVGALAQGRSLVESVHIVLTELDAFEGGDVTARVLRRAVALAEHGPVAPLSLEELGSGWDAPAALAIAVAAALSHPNSYSDAVSLAATHSGNSAATATICGSLLGARRGAEAIPAEWVQALELREVLGELLADDDRRGQEIAEEPTVRRAPSIAPSAR
ncbi:ADP-ribosylglycohydrolase [Halopolyspora algeriensis]|uniref:ADP-ribosylglycohydrolase n=1 Tax=Halopolyspora algeriensis TaxID=1500506 RepID=A0A368VJW7_9ACTN|nr:type VII secretion system-associated protein [Halopolyspora algeriensis]RCW40812.1 ADP-ribosylglycohydrolase [Halopolyspora algeriensis]TQM53271.1 ADP-ribosylglycohydrolase [Halopolyspora algeriensis]